MNQAITVFINDKTVRLGTNAFFVKSVVCFINFLMALAKPVQRHIGTQHTYLPPLMVVNMNQISNGQLLRSRTVEIWRRPTTFFFLESGLIPRVYQKVGMGFVHLLAMDGARPFLPSINFVVMTFLGKDIRFENQATTRHVLVKRHHTLQMFLQLIRIVDIVLNDIDIINRSHIHIGEDATNLFVGMQNNTLITLFCFMSHRVARYPVDSTHDDHRHHDQYRHNPYTEPVSKRPCSFSHFAKIVLSTAAKIVNFHEKSKNYWQNKQKSHKCDSFF